MLTIEQIKQALRDEDLKVLKSLGQNFLLDEGALSAILEAAELTPRDTVLEVGPGMGVLTFALAPRCREVVAIEKDRKMSQYLRREITREDGKTANVEILTEDILRVNLPELLESRGIEKYKVVANIPYYITSPILRLFLETAPAPAEMVLLVQKEVAERICAVRGDMSVLALSVLFYGEPEIVRVVGKEAFYPAPKVDSAILRIRHIGKRYPEADYQEVFRLIKMGFSSRRKKLLNNLAGGLKRPKAELLEKLVQAGVGAEVRAQDLGAEEWIRLAEVLLEK